MNLARLSLPFALLAAHCAPNLFGHATGENYVFINVLEDKIEGHFEIYFEDLEEKLGISIQGDESSFLEQINESAPEARRYIRNGFSIRAGQQALDIRFTRNDHFVIRQGRIAQYYFEIDAPSLPDLLTVEHRMLFENDFMHRGLLLLDYNHKTQKSYGEEHAVLVFSEDKPVAELDLSNPPEIIWGFLDMVPEGVWHIWIGIDHILFLVALLLPTVIHSRGGQTMPEPALGPILWKVAKIVTVFTVAHSITLALAAFKLITISSRLVESVIALSIVLVALNNIIGKYKGGSLTAILFLGLFHGLGFASVMGELPFRMASLERCLIGFNVGVELGQLAIVAVLLPVLFLIRTSSLYRPAVIFGGSGALILVASVWFVERAFGL